MTEVNLNTLHSIFSATQVVIWLGVLREAPTAERRPLYMLQLDLMPGLCLCPYLMSMRPLDLMPVLA